MKNSVYICRKIYDMSISRYLIYTIFAATLFSCAGTGKDGDKPIITVSIEPQRQILESLAGDEYDIISILSRGANPETFDPSMSQRAAAAKSVAFISTGAFPFERTLSEALTEQQKYFDCSEGIEKIYGTHDHCHAYESHDHDHEGDPDPHVWSSTVNVRIMAANMANALAELNPANKAIYSARLDSLGHVIDKLDDMISSQLAETGIKAFVIWHPSLSYFARDYGLRQISVGQESKEISPLRLREIIDEAKADSVRVFFFQKEFDSRQAAGINSKIGSRLIVIDPLAYDWMSQLKRIADELSR